MMQMCSMCTANINYRRVNLLSSVEHGKVHDHAPSAVMNAAESGHRTKDENLPYVNVLRHLVITSTSSNMHEGGARGN